MGGSGIPTGKDRKQCLLQAERPGPGEGDREEDEGHPREEIKKKGPA